MTEAQVALAEHGNYQNNDLTHLISRSCPLTPSSVCQRGVQSLGARGLGATRHLHAHDTVVLRSQHALSVLSPEDRAEIMAQMKYVFSRQE